MPTDETTSTAGRTPAVLARGAGLTAAVLAGAVVGHCLTGGHVPGPAVLGALAALVLVAGVLGARTTAGVGARVVTVLAAAALAVALHPVLAMLATRPGAVPAIAETHATHGTGRPGAAEPASPPDTGVDLGPLLAAGIDLDAVRAAGSDLDALVAAGLDAPTLAAAGLDPADPHAPHTVAALVAAADRAAAAPADGAGAASVDGPPAPAAVDGAASADDGVAPAAAGDRARTTEQVDTPPVVLLGLPQVDAQVALAVTVLVTLLLAGAVLSATPRPRRLVGASPAAPAGV